LYVPDFIHYHASGEPADFHSQGRAGLVALRRYRGEAVGALGKAYYKGGFEPKMNRREAALILQLKYVPLDV
jgi:hypothetical protein